MRGQQRQVLPRAVAHCILDASVIGQRRFRTILQCIIDVLDGDELQRAHNAHEETG